MPAFVVEGEQRRQQRLQPDSAGGGLVVGQALVLGRRGGVGRDDDLDQARGHGLDHRLAVVLERSGGSTLQKVR
jgi:hypothetical protein